MPNNAFAHSSNVLRLRCKPWLEDRHLLAAWTIESQILLRQTLQPLFAALKPYLKPSCTHLKRNGGVKGTARYLTRQLCMAKTLPLYRKSQTFRGTCSPAL